MRNIFNLPSIVYLFFILLLSFSIFDAKFINDILFSFPFLKSLHRYEKGKGRKNLEINARIEGIRYCRIDFP